MRLLLATVAALATLLTGVNAEYESKVPAGPKSPSRSTPGAGGSPLAGAPGVGAACAARCQTALWEGKTHLCPAWCSGLWEQPSLATDLTLVPADVNMRLEYWTLLAVHAPLVKHAKSVYASLRLFLDGPVVETDEIRFIAASAGDKFVLHKLRGLSDSDADGSHFVNQLAAAGFQGVQQDLVDSDTDCAYVKVDVSKEVQALVRSDKWDFGDFLLLLVGVFDENGTPVNRARTSLTQAEMAFKFKRPHFYKNKYGDLWPAKEDLDKSDLQFGLVCKPQAPQSTPLLNTFPTVLTVTAMKGGNEIDRQTVPFDFQRTCSCLAVRVRIVREVVFAGGATGTARITLRDSSSVLSVMDLQTSSTGPDTVEDLFALQESGTYTLVFRTQVTGGGPPVDTVSLSSNDIRVDCVSTDELFTAAPVTL